LRHSVVCTNICFSICFADDTICSGVGIGFLPSQVKHDYSSVNFHFVIVDYPADYFAVVVV